MNLTKLSLALSCCVAISMLGGCAATVKSSGTDTLAIREAAKRNIILELQGNTRVEQNKDWPRLKEEWSQALHVEATQAGYEVGTRTIVDVLISQQTLLQAQSNYSASRHTFVLNGLLLKQAAGIIDVKDLEAVNALLE